MSSATPIRSDGTSPVTTSSSEARDISEDSTVQNVMDAGAAAGQLKGDSHNQESGGDATPGNDTRLSSKPEVSWASFASLWCSVNGRSHFILVDFGMSTCPACSQDLRPKLASDVKPEPVSMPTKSEMDDSNAEPYGYSNVADTEGEANSAKVTDKTQPVSYYVEYWDKGDHSIANVSWSKPFDLAAERKYLTPPKQSSVFDVTTILSTSIPGDGFRLRSEKDALLKKGIVNNPSIDISVSMSKMTIYSQAILRAIAAVAAYYPSVDLTRGPVTLYEPYTIIAHYLQELEDYQAACNDNVDQNDTPSTTAAVNAPASSDRESFEHLGLLLRFFEANGVKIKVEEEKARHAKGVCTFRMLWLLFKPGMTVYVYDGGQSSARVISALEIDPKILLQHIRFFSPHSFRLWNLNFDGHYVGRSQLSFTIPYFEGERSITSLKIIPSDLMDVKDNGMTRRMMEERGKMWYSLLGGKQVFHQGNALSTPANSFHGRVFVDLGSYYSNKSECRPTIHDVEDFGEGLDACLCEKCRGQRPHPPEDFPWACYDVLDPQKLPDLEDTDNLDNPKHRYLLCEGSAWGLALKTRTWVQVDVAHCYEAVPKTTAIDSLVMSMERKNMIKALVHKYTDQGLGKAASIAWGADFIENKGEGQIFLLHGGPGVGKTFTAECIAEYTGRALLSLNCGDVGTDEEEMEQRLSKWFKLAEKWGAVILIDEADVYLERRHVSDLKRNSLVSVFLRSIEYYRGILFLTTNRVGHFDDAFVSRIHVVIRYENLGVAERKQIWTQFFDKLSNDREEFTITRRAKSFVLENEALQAMEWNGREIRNVFQTAVALAEFRFSQKPKGSKDDGPTLDDKDFEQVCEMTQQFKQYLIDVHGADEENRAFVARARASNLSLHSTNKAKIQDSGEDAAR